MHNTFFLRKKYYRIKRRFYKWALHFFLVLFDLVMFHESQNEVLWPSKNCKFDILCTLILFNPLNHQIKINFDSK
jgi:hypothetical protein